MGYELMRRVLADERIPKEHVRLALILADHCHDGDEQPCCWVSPAKLTLEVEGANNDATGRRFRRSIKALIEAGVIKRTDVPHEGRPKSRKCPRDGRRLHVELFPLVEAARPLNGNSETAESEQIVDAERPLNPESSGRLTVEIVDVQRPLHRGTIEDPPSKEDPASNMRSSDGDSSTSESEEPAVGLLVESTSQLQKSTT